MAAATPSIGPVVEKIWLFGDQFLGRERLVRSADQPNQRFAYLKNKHLTRRIKDLARFALGIPGLEEKRKNQLGRRGCKHSKVSLCDTSASSRSRHGRRVPRFCGAWSDVRLMCEM